MLHVQIPDQLLIKKISRDDHQAFQVLFDNYWESLFHYAFKVLQNKQDAEEVVQEFFIHVWNKRHDLPELQSVAAYIFTGLKNRLLNHLAKKKYPVTSLDELQQDESEFSAVRTLEQKDAESLLRSLVNTLPRKMKQVFELHQFVGLTTAEIAAVTGNSEQTVRNQLNSAIKKLRLVCKAELYTLLFFLLSQKF